MADFTRKREPCVSTPRHRVEYLGNRYRLGRRIGSGGMGDVYEVIDIELGQKKAAKILKTNDAFAVRRFQREARLAATVAHPNLCEVLESGACERGSFLIMPLLEGRPLSKILKKGALEIGRSVEIACGILSGLSAIHDAGIIHRDLKPSNIFVSPLAGEQAVKLLDFGVAADTNVVPRKTTHNIVLGTPYYMAPERLSHNVFNVRTDIYAMGVVLYEMITGKKPYTGAPFEVWDKILSCAEMYVPPGRVVPNLSFELEEIIMRSMCRLPQDRFENASSMKRALQRAPLETGDDRARKPQEMTQDDLPVPSGLFRGDF